MYSTAIRRKYQKVVKTMTRKLVDCVVDTWVFLGLINGPCREDYLSSISSLCENKLLANWLRIQVGHNRGEDLMFAQGDMLMLESLKRAGLLGLAFTSFNVREAPTSSKLDTKEAKSRGSLLD